MSKTKGWNQTDTKKNQYKPLISCHIKVYNKVKMDKWRKPWEIWEIWIAYIRTHFRVNSYHRDHVIIVIHSRPSYFRTSGLTWITLRICDSISWLCRMRSEGLLGGSSESRNKGFLPFSPVILLRLYMG